MFFHCLFIKFLGFAYSNGKRPGGALSQTGSQSVAISFGHELGLSIHNLNGAFGAGRHTLAASVTEIFIDFYDFSFDFHGVLLLQEKVKYKFAIYI
jgi:hypothetical protein